MEDAVRAALASSGVIEDTVPFAETNGFEHTNLIGVCKSLASNDFIACANLSKNVVRLSGEGRTVASGGSPEAEVFALVPATGSIPQDKLAAAAGPAAKVGLAKAVQNKWLEVAKEDGAKVVKRAVASIVDAVQQQLQAVEAAGDQEAAIPADALAMLKKRNLIAAVTVKSLKVSPGPMFESWGVKAVADLTHEMLVKGTWRDQAFKPLNLEAAGKPPAGGSLHPLMKVRAMFRDIFLEMGFEEMATQQYVESSFWNFDALFQPQQHPARDAHDTFFIKQPAAAPSVPAEYLQRVKQTHELGGEGLPAEYAAESRGWRYDWSEEESRKNLLRTHTTAASSRTLYAIAEEMRKGGEFRPQKYFSIDRVFRNEALDATHLAEFHQVEGFIIDRNLSLGNLMGTIADFYKRLGPEFSDLKFKPTYNPYTEPSMEFHAYHPGLGKWVEVGNSGVFRPEMLRPMGFPPDVSVIAWGMSLERPTMIKYGFKNIRDLFGHKIDLNLVRSHPIVRWDVDAPAASDDPAAKKASADLD